MYRGDASTSEHLSYTNEQQSSIRKLPHEAEALPWNAGGSRASMNKKESASMTAKLPVSYKGRQQSPTWQSPRELETEN
jgi:hypothetical protein